MRVPFEHLGARIYPDMFSLAQAHKALVGGRIADRALEARFETNLQAFLSLAEAAKHYPCMKRAWVEFLGEPPDPEPVMHLVLEGVQRHDHLQRGRTLVPDDAALAATGRSPSTVPNEPDYDLVVKLWEKACAGQTPGQCAAELPFDAFRIWNALAHWVEEGALALK